MTQVNLHEAKTHLSRLVERAMQGEDVVIAKAGKAKVRLVPVETREETAKRRIGFLDGQFKVPDDFDTMFADEIEAMFNGKP
jgi:prevent-host-death family protein